MEYKFTHFFGRCISCTFHAEGVTYNDGKGSRNTPVWCGKGHTELFDTLAPCVDYNPTRPIQLLPEEVFGNRYQMGLISPETYLNACHILEIINQVDATCCWDAESQDGFPKAFFSCDTRHPTDLLSHHMQMSLMVTGNFVKVAAGFIITQTNLCGKIKYNDFYVNAYNPDKLLRTLVEVCMVEVPRFAEADFAPVGETPISQWLVAATNHARITDE